jgi:hypothetical protein
MESRPGRAPRRLDSRSARVRTSFVGNIDASIGQIQNARRKSKAQQVAEAKHMIGQSSIVGIESLPLDETPRCSNSAVTLEANGMSDHPTVERPQKNEHQPTSIQILGCRNLAEALVERSQ